MRHRPGSLLALVISTVANAGDFGVREFQATVSSLSVKETYAIPDRWAATFGKPGKQLEGRGPVCAIGLDVAFPGPQFRKAFGAQVAIASSGACQRLKRGQAVRVQTMGLAGELQVISLAIDGSWFSLPLMRRSEVSDHPTVKACLSSTERQCDPLLGTEPL